MGLGRKTFWLCRNNQQGSILMSAVGKDGVVQSHVQMIKVRMQSTVNDLKVFDRRAQSGKSLSCLD